MSLPVKIALIGYGSSSNRYHIPFILANPHVHLYAVLQRSSPTEGKPHVSRDHPDVKWVKTIDELLGLKEVEVVVVCTGVDSHLDFAKKVIEAGKHVVVEKPFTRTVEEADELIALAKAKGVLLTVYQNRRWDADFLTLRKNLPHLGKIHEATFHHDLYSPAMLDRFSKTEEDITGEGMSYIAGSHPVDQALLLFGVPERVTGFHMNLRGKPGVEDSYTITLHYADRVVFIKTNPKSVLARHPTHFIRGDQGTFVKYGNDTQLAQYAAGVNINDPSFGEDKQEGYATLSTLQKVDEGQKEVNGVWTGTVKTEKGNWSEFYNKLAGAVRGKGDGPVDAQDSREGIKVIQLAKKSHDEQRTVRWDEL